MRPKLTLKQIARELDVSISTVSKALRDSAEISEDTKQKVKAFAKLYNYKPNNIALSLKNRKTKTIGLIVPEIVHHFFTTVIRGIEEYANEKGYHVMVCLSNNSFDKEVINMEMLANGSIDGFILSISKETMLKEDYHHINEVINQGMPVVMFDRVVDQIKCDKVVIDDVEGATKAVQHLLDTGCKKVGLITTPDYINVGKLRTQGYTEALNKNRMPIHEKYILKIEDDSNSEELIKEFVKTEDFDGIFAVNEEYAVQAISALRKTEKEIPEDVSVIGFTDGVISKNFIPKLTTVNQPGTEMGRQAAKLIIDKLEKPETEEEEQYQTIEIKTNLVKRESTR
ncbi:LacI family DNA-binding transcriptional regulator [Gangjinia marincola]|uniref:LacI family DNA-binding transcriptional regulator n=1 Tax=Gangjinia marincola TaxID=578463 RepID=A0ABN1MH76_9FLAO